MKTLLALLLVLAPPVAAQEVTVPLEADNWVASDSIRFETHLGRPSLWINRGTALAKGSALENGVYELDMAADTRSNFMGAAFRAASPTFTDVLFLRLGQSGTPDAVQFGPAFNSLGVAWQVYHGEGANAVAVLERNRWTHLRVVIEGGGARIFVDTATTPTVVVPHLPASGGSAVGVWTGAFGRGAWFSNIRYTPAASAAEAAAPPPPAGTITEWQLSNSVEAGDFTRDRLPDLARLSWAQAKAEPEGFVLINRYREAPVGGTPTDAQGNVLVDSIMTGRMAGERVVYARATINADRDGVRRLQYAYCNGAVIYLNGRPLVMSMNPSGLRAPLGSMARSGDAVYLPLHRGHNELVFAVIEVTGGWAFSARLDQP